MRKHRTPRPPRRYRFLGAVALALAGVALPAAPAHAYRARLRWLPSADRAVIGYQVYVRQAFRPYTTPINVGMPRRAADGSMSWVVGGLTSARTYYFAVSAYTSKREGWLSREIALGETDPCVIDRCFTRTACDIRMLDDGATCGEGPCAVCRFARCTPLPPLDLTASTISLSAQAEGTLVRVRGRFAPPSRVSPGTTGLVLGFADRAGTMLSETTVPAGALHTNASGTRFHIRTRDLVPGVHRLTLWVGPTHVRISAVLSRSDLVNLSGRTDLTWVLRFGSEQCAIDADLVCGDRRCR